MKRLLILGSLLTAVLTVQIHPLDVFAEEPTGTITIVQENESRDILGSWTLIRPDNNRVHLDKHDRYEKPDAIAGKYSLLIEQPEGATTQTIVYRNGEIIFEKDQPQAAFDLEPNDNIVIQILYKFTQTGNVSVGSDPAGVRFTIKGPNDWKDFGTTPEAYPDSPIGLYSVTYKPPEGCPEPRAQSDRLEKDGRIDFGITISCDKMADATTDDGKRFTHVTMMADGKEIALDDVPQSAWFAHFVHKVARTGVMSGYKDSRGGFTGKYGPGDNVTLAQLAKIAVEVSGIDQDPHRGRSTNNRARGQWFEQYFKVAEEHSWQVYRDERLDPGRPATRSEVVTTLLQALEVSRIWPKGQLFNDVQPDTAYAASIETAAEDELIGGYEDGTFRPNDPINRAEMAKVVSLAIELYIEDSAEFQPDN